MDPTAAQAWALTVQLTTQSQFNHFQLGFLLTVFSLVVDIL
jgi:hypothetical protein